jgi:hypothetical protein
MFTARRAGFSDFGFGISRAAGMARLIDFSHQSCYEPARSADRLRFGTNAAGTSPDGSLASIRDV